jgi:hypothetical protein
MKSTKSIGYDQGQRTAFRLYIESHEKDPFERDIDALDLLTLQVLSDALRDNVKSPFSLKFFDADQVFIGGRRINIEKTSVELEVTFQFCGSVRVPLTCKIVDASGRTYKRILSEAEARKWVSAYSFEGSYIEGPIYWIKSTRTSDSPTFSPQVYSSKRPAPPFSYCSRASGNISFLS